MNDRISWDPTLVKKFSSSNHYKLLNQLKNEVKKYPLNNKKKAASIQTKDNNLDSKSKLKISYSQDIPISNKTNQGNEEDTNKSTVSFNNSKNFSIYNNSNISRQNVNPLLDKSNSIDDYTS